MPLPPIDPPLINSSNPWATSLADLQALFDCTSTGAVTTRTSLLNGFDHNDAHHQYTFFNPGHGAKPANVSQGEIPASFGGSLNTLGYSPILLSEYLAMISKVVKDSSLPQVIRDKKPFIVSVTGSSEDVVKCYRMIQAAQANLSNPLCMEINLSCPNIPDKPPPAYSRSSLTDYLVALGQESTPAGQKRVSIGIKTPPYTYHDQYQTLADALLDANSTKLPVDFITATNTLGSSLVLNENNETPVLGSASGLGIGGMAGSPLHPLALGNVKTIRSFLDRHDQLSGIDIIGIGGVSDRSGFDRMQAVGALVVGVSTALGREGTSIFAKIIQPPST